MEQEGPPLAELSESDVSLALAGTEVAYTPAVTVVVIDGRTYKRDGTIFRLQRVNDD